MLFRRLKFSGLLSFGTKGIDLPMEPLTVLIGPNGSGKSNFLEAIGLLQAAPKDIQGPILQRDNVREWLWKGPESPQAITLEAEVGYASGKTARHALILEDDLGGRPYVTKEQIELLNGDVDGSGFRAYCKPPIDESVTLEMRQNAKSRLSKEEPLSLVETKGDVVHFSGLFQPGGSLLSSAASPERPLLWRLSEQYRRIRLYRNWSFGPDAKIRVPCSAHLPSDFLEEGAENLAVVLSQLSGESKTALLRALRELFEGIVDIRCSVTGGTVAFFLEEAGNRSIPAFHLSDGTLRYLSLLAVLMHPKPPSLICIEEPELGLHPDLLPMLCDLMLDASSRSQIIVTTHSDVFVDELTDWPESVVVCEKHEGQTEMQRLDKVDLAKWLKDYSLGHLWTSGELGGNRW